MLRHADAIQSINARIRRPPVAGVEAFDGVGTRMKCREDPHVVLLVSASGVELSRLDVDEPMLATAPASRGSDPRRR